MLSDLVNKFQLIF